MELTRTNAVFSRIAMVLFLRRNKILGMTWIFTRIFCGIYKKYWRKNQPEEWSEEPTSSPVAAPWPRLAGLWGPRGSTATNPSSIYSLSSGKKNQGEEFIAFYDTEAPPPPVLPLEGRSGVRSGLRRGEIVAIVIINLPSSPIP